MASHRSPSRGFSNPHTPIGEAWQFFRDRNKRWPSKKERDDLEQVIYQTEDGVWNIDFKGFLQVVHGKEPSREVLKLERENIFKDYFRPPCPKPSFVQTPEVNRKPPSTEGSQEEEEHPEQSNDPIPEWTAAFKRLKADMMDKHDTEEEDLEPSQSSTGSSEETVGDEGVKEKKSTSLVKKMKKKFQSSTESLLGKNKKNTEENPKPQEPARPNKKTPVEPTYVDMTTNNKDAYAGARPKTSTPKLVRNDSSVEFSEEERGLRDSVHRNEVRMETTIEKIDKFNLDDETPRNLIKENQQNLGKLDLARTEAKGILQEFNNSVNGIREILRESNAEVGILEEARRLLMDKQRICEDSQQHVRQLYQINGMKEKAKGVKWNIEIIRNTVQQTIEDLDKEILKLKQQQYEEISSEKSQSRMSEGRYEDHTENDRYVTAQEDYRDKVASHHDEPAPVPPRPRPREMGHGGGSFKTSDSKTTGFWYRPIPLQTPTRTVREQFPKVKHLDQPRCPPQSPQRSRYNYQREEPHYEARQKREEMHARYQRPPPGREL